MIDKAPILAIPPKVFGDKHFAAEFNKFRMFLLSLADEANKRAMGYTGSLRITDPMPTVPGLYKLMEFGTYANLAPAVDASGNASSITAVDGKINEAYYDGTKWVNSKITIPGITASTTFDPVDDSNPSTMKATAGRYDPAVSALDGFLIGDGPEYLAYDKTLEGFSINGINPIVKTDQSIVIPKSDGTINEVAGGLPSGGISITWINVPTKSGNKKITRLKRIGRIVGGNSTNKQCVMIGFKPNNTIDILINGTLPPPDNYQTDNIDLTPYDFFSLLMFSISSSDTAQKLEIYEKLSTASVSNVKNYIDNENQIKASSSDERITIEGQSNAVGYASKDDLIASYPGVDWSKEFSRVYIWNPSTNQYENLKIGKNTFGIGSDIGQFPIANSSPSDKYFGIEIPIALLWLETHKHGNLYINKNTGNGQPISYFQKGSAFYTEKTSRLVKADKWLLDRGITVKDSVYIWIQGEADANSNTYLADLQKLITDRKNDKSIKENTRIGIAQVNASNAAYSTAVANAKTQYVANDLKSFLITYPNSLRNDNVHLTTSGIVSMGMLFGAKCFKTDAYSYTDLTPKSNWVI